MFTDTSYDKVRKWISDERKEGRSWEYFVNGELDLDTFLTSAETIFHCPKLTKEDFIKIVELLKEAEEATLKFVKDVSINDEFQEGGVTEVPDWPDSSWQTYKKKLYGKGFNETSVFAIEQSAFKLLKKISLDTRETGPRKGLVIGNVQSGKTANMAALMAMAADFKWNMFIVLSGTIENLRKQTQDRLFNDLHDPQCNLVWTSLTLKDGKALYESGGRAQDKSFNSNNRYMTVILKNQAHLKNLITWLKQDGNARKQMKILLIDDEADQAGINTASENQKRKTINRLICNLVNGKDKDDNKVEDKFYAMNYIAYTATPYANVLNEHGQESTYPRNFISALGVSKEYFGPQQIFGCEDTNYDGLDIIRYVAKDDLDVVKAIHDGNTDSLPASLIHAICWFLCCVSCQRYWGYKKPVSMLVHTSQKTDQHSYVADAIERWITKGVKNDTIIKECKKLWNLETEKFNKIVLRAQYQDYDRKNEDIPVFPKFSEIENTLKYLLESGISNIPLDEESEPDYHDGIHLCIDNCKNNRSKNGMKLRLVYPSTDQTIARAFIVVGGATLSRGLTIEGLTSTYFLRSIKQADTLMQMGRWFGYRKGYEVLPRIWMTRKIREQFDFLSVLDKKLRDEIKRMEDLGIAPANYGPRVLSHPQASFLKISAKNRIKGAYRTDYSGVASQTTTFDNNVELLNKNLELTRQFLESLGDPMKQKACNKHSEHSQIWQNVDFILVRSFLESFHYSNRQAAFNDIKRMMKWFEVLTKKKKLGPWNVVLAGVAKSGNPWYVDDHVSVTKVCRSQLKNQQEGILNIKSLRGPKDILADVDLERASQEIIDLVKNFKSEGGVAIRNKAGLDKTPQLLIYIIDKDSKADPDSTTRADLNAAADIVGLCINVPENNNKDNNYMVAIPIDDNSFNYIEEIDIDGADETDGN